MNLSMMTDFLIPFPCQKYEFMLQLERKGLLTKLRVKPRNSHEGLIQSKKADVQKERYLIFSVLNHKKSL